MKAGCALFSGGDGTWRLYGPGDRFARITGPAEVLVEVSALLAAPREGRTPIEPESTAAALIAALDARGVLEGPASSRESATSGRRIAVVGQNPVGEAVAGLMRDFARVELSAPPTNVSDADVLVWCAGQLPDREWLQIDGMRGAAGLPWHMSYFEGDRVILGPFSVPGRTASYRDTRCRRLAAAASPDDLCGLWHHLDASPPQPMRWPPAAAVAIVAGLLANDVLAHLQGQAVPSAGDQLEVDLATATVARHAVLPVPALAGA